MSRDRLPVAEHPVLLIVIGAVMLIVGWLIVFLTVIKIIEENFYLIMFAYAINLAGLFLGLYGLTSHIFIEKIKKKHKHPLEPSE
ncbi:MAG: hypothetical protein ABWW65_05410 [Thermoprotei archaeon]